MKRTLQLPETHLKKLRETSYKFVCRMTGISDSAYRNATKTGKTSRIVLNALGSFFEFTGVGRLDWDELDAEITKRPCGQEKPTGGQIGSGQFSTTGDTWGDIRRLYVNRQVDEALALAECYRKSSRFEEQLAAWRSLIYIYSRIGWQSHLMWAVSNLRRITGGPHHAKFTEADRIVTARDIAKSLVEHGCAQLADPLYGRLREIHEARRALLAPSSQSSFFRGVGQQRYLLGDREGAYLAYRAATEREENSLDGQTANASSVVESLYDRDPSSKSYRKAWEQFDEQMDLALRPDRGRCQDGVGDGTPEKAASGTTLAGLMVINAFHPRHDAKRALELADQYAIELHQARLADYKMFAAGYTRDTVLKMDRGRPCGKILRRMLKDEMLEDDAKTLVSFAGELLKNA